MTNLIDALQKALHSKPVHVHPYESLAGSGGPPDLDSLTNLEVYLDGSAEGPADGRAAALGFTIGANIPLHLGQHSEMVDENHFVVFRRYGRVITNPASNWYVGATQETNSTGEISAFIEAMIYVLFETTLASDFSMRFVFDSLLSGFQTMGHWRRSDERVNVEVARTAYSLWRALNL